MLKGLRMFGRARRCLMAVCLFVLAGLILPALPWAAEMGVPPKEEPLLFSFFKSFVSTTDSKRCSHVPSCARYAKDAVEAHGPIKGYILSCDRLIRCGGDDTQLLPQVVVDGKRYAWDPVSANDFWWGNRESPGASQSHPAPSLVFEAWD